MYVLGKGKSQNLEICPRIANVSSPHLTRIIRMALTFRDIPPLPPMSLIL